MQYKGRLSEMAAALIVYRIVFLSKKRKWLVIPGSTSNDDRSKSRPPDSGLLPERGAVVIYGGRESAALGGRGLTWVIGRLRQRCLSAI